MISTQILLRYPFFGTLSETQLREIARISEEVSYEKGEIIFEECQPAQGLYLLMEGGVDLTFKSQAEYYPKTSKVFHVGEINPGEIFSISSLIEPYVLNATATASSQIRAIKINAPALRALFEEDYDLAYHVMVQINKALMERLVATRVQLAAAWAK